MKTWCKSREGNLIVSQYTRKITKKIGEGHLIFSWYHEGSSIIYRKVGEGHVWNENYDRYSSNPPPPVINVRSLRAAKNQRFMRQNKEMYSYKLVSYKFLIKKCRPNDIRFLNDTLTLFHPGGYPTSDKTTNYSKSVRAESPSFWDFYSFGSFGTIL